GGHSLLAMQVITRIRQQMQFELTLNTVLETPTIAALAETLQDKPQARALVETSVLKPTQSLNTPSATPVPTQLASQPTIPPNHQLQTGRMDFSLFFFSADGSAGADNKYQLFLDSVRFADDHNFTAVWTPERHFHSFGGLYPNPSILGAAMATMTQHIQIRAGSVVLPFQDPLRVAEEWSVIDNLSGGRVGIACASGWHTNDFVLAPDNYETRKQVMDDRIEAIQKLWRGETISRTNGSGKPTPTRIYPDPIQPQLPMWLASHGDATFVKAGEMGLNLLTVLWDTTIEEVARKIELYHKTLIQNDYDPDTRTVTLMLHTFIDDSMPFVREVVESAYEAYLSVNLGLQTDQIQGVDRSIDLTQDDKAFIIAHATEQLFQTRGLVGTPEICLEKVKALHAIGVTEIACLIDFGVDHDVMMNSLTKLNEVKLAFNENQPLSDEFDEGWI
ncbi:MAG: MupA/Atu3671 family FMN-dependent luciferase-like monooxygenase, partial [Chloroflexota bacterium]